MGKLLGVVAMALVVGAALFAFGKPQAGPGVRIATLGSLSVDAAPEAETASPVISDGGSRRMRQVSAGLPDQIDMSALPPLDRPGI